MATFTFIRKIISIIGLAVASYVAFMLNSDPTDITKHACNWYLVGNPEEKICPSWLHDNLGPRVYDILYIVVLLFLVDLFWPVIAWLAKRVRSLVGRLPKVEWKSSLTEDQRQFRVHLKQFVGATIPRLNDGASHVISFLKTKEKEISKANPCEPHSIALHAFMHFALPGINYENLKGAVSVGLGQMDTEVIWKELQLYINQYQWLHKHIGNLNAIVKIDLDSLEQMRKWLSADEAASTEIENLNVWARDEGLKPLHISQMASGDKLWNTQHKVNW